MKVLDFGISKMHGTKEASLTQTGVALGTPYFMSPELCQAVKDIDARTDVYAIGVVMFLALTAQHPFDDETYPMLVLKICTQPPPPIQRFRPDLPPELAAIIERTLAKDRNQRFADCRELKAALAPFAHMTEAPRVAPDAPRTAQLKPDALQDSGVRSSGHAATTPLPSYGDQPSPISHGGQMESAAWSADAPRSQPPPRAQRSLLLPAVLVLSLVAILGVIAVVLVFALPGQSRGPDVASSDDQAATTEPATTQPAATAPAVAPAPATPPAQTENVHVRIAVTPAEAEIVLGDRILQNPFDGDLPRSSEPRTLLFRAPGYTSVQQQVTLTESQQIQLVLQREAVTSRHGSRHHGSVAPTPIVTPMAPSGPSHPRPSGPSLAGGNTMGI